MGWLGIAIGCLRTCFVLVLIGCEFVTCGFVLLVGLAMLGGIVFGLRSLGWGLVYLVILCASVLAGLVGLLLALCLRFVAVNSVVSY